MARPIKLKVCDQCRNGRISAVFAPGKAVCLVCAPPRGDQKAAEAALQRDTEAKARERERNERVAAHRGKGTPEALAAAKAEREAAQRRCPTCEASISKTATLCSSCYGKKRSAEAAGRAGFISPTFVAEIDAVLGLTQFLSANTVVRCTCCRDTTNLVTDPSGNVWCARCAYYVAACGACPPHHSPVFYPSLSGNPVPPPPPTPMRTYTPVPIPVDADEPA